SMINTHFANMQGTDIMKFSDEERDILIKAGLEFPKTEDGEMSNQVEIVWDTMRANFDFEVDPEQDKAKDDADKLEGLTKVAELSASDPTFAQDLAAVNKKFNKGELYADMIALTTDNDKIITDVGPKEEQGQIDPATGQPIAPANPQDPNVPQQPPGPDPLQQADLAAKEQKMQQSDELHQAKMAKLTAPSPSQPTNQPAAPEVTPEEMKANVEAVMKEYNVDEPTALAALAAEHQGYPKEDIIMHLQNG